mmetsp:Transcript_3828/g.9666  ORF Transcript_3828/g.9666 Transcript_3828/m.9666 type:complete len:251 (+) Transcript_3828:2266-3018(+)
MAGLIPAGAAFHASATASPSAVPFPASAAGSACSAVPSSRVAEANGSASATKRTTSTPPTGRVYSNCCAGDSSETIPWTLSTSERSRGKPVSSNAIAATASPARSSSSAAVSASPLTSATSSHEAASTFAVTALTEAASWPGVNISAARSSSDGTAAKAVARSSARPGATCPLSSRHCATAAKTSARGDPSIHLAAVSPAVANAATTASRRAASRAPSAAAAVGSVASGAEGTSIDSISSILSPRDERAS